MSNHGRGVYFYDSTNITVSSNDFLNLVGPHYAIGLFNGDSTASITGNRIDGGCDGLQIADDFGTAQLGRRRPPEHLVNLTNATIEFINEGGTAYTGTLDASENYWGTSNPATIATSFIPDAGPVPPVAFTPFLNNNQNPAFQSTPGFHADLSSVTTTSLGAQLGNPLQQAINVAASRHHHRHGCRQLQWHHHQQEPDPRRRQPAAPSSSAPRPP